ncbi:hypothetical protein LY76DRAFT_626026 [Colletotrichum caudatum]|nr:hypothetical protein LY76DRAFT_626026 [Colletotrichum caudatum]
MQFRYEPLDLPRSIRVFVLYPGNFGDGLTGSLFHSPFPDDASPTYSFLSYAWKDSSEADATLPLAKSDKGWDCRNNSCTIRINDQPFQIGHNLALALLHDNDERRFHAKLVTKIVLQARAVISWLGPDCSQQFQPKRPVQDPWTRMKCLWDLGKSKLLETTHQQSIPEALLGEKAYWSRIWAPHDLYHAQKVLFVCGTNVWRERDFVDHMLHVGTRPIVKTLQARKNRHIRPYFGSLLLNYHSYESESPLDMLYALMSLSFEWHSGFAAKGGLNVIPNPATDMSLVHFIIDYSQTPYQAWVDLMKCTVGVTNPMGHQRTANIVRFAALAQKALGGLDPEPRTYVQMRHSAPLLIFSQGITAKGYIAGYVHYIGRSYRHIATSHEPHISGDWMPLFEDEADNDGLRAFVQRYTAKVIGSRRLERATTSYSGLSLADQTRGWVIREGTDNPKRALNRACGIAAQRNKLPAMQLGELVQFVGTDGNVGFASLDAGIAVGDRIIAFQDCHVGFVARSLPGSSCLQIISIADVETPPSIIQYVNDELEGHHTPTLKGSDKNTVYGLTSKPPTTFSGAYPDAVVAVLPGHDVAELSVGAQNEVQLEEPSLLDGRVVYKLPATGTRAREDVAREALGYALSEKPQGCRGGWAVDDFQGPQASRAST